MAVNLFKVGSVYHYRFQLNGKRIQKTTGERVKYKALEIAEAEYTRARLEARAVESIPTLIELIEKWLAFNDKTASVNHIKTIDNFRRLHLYDLGGLLITELTTEKIDLTRLKHLENYSRASVNQWLTILKLIVNWAVKREIIHKLPFKTALLKLQKKPRVTLSLEQSGEWFRALDEYAVNRPELSLAARLMFGLGLRESETLTARWEWLDVSRATYTAGITKGREAEPLPVPKWLLDYLEIYRRKAGLMVMFKNNKLASGFTRSAFRYANKKLGLTGITPHRLRGSYATLLSETGLPIQNIQYLLRHKDYRTTMKYVEKNLELATRAQDSIGLKPDTEQ